MGSSYHHLNAFVSHTRYLTPTPPALSPQYLHAVQNFIHSGAATEQSVLEDVRAAHAQRLAELAAVDAAAQAGPLAAAQAAAAAMQAAAAAAAVHAAGGG